MVKVIMGIYIIKRLFHSFFVLLGITLLVFFLLYLSGDPVRLLMPFDATVEQLEAAREELGFNDPFHIQYLRFLSRVVRLDFGMSLRRHMPAIDLVKEHFPNTLLLASSGFLLAIVIAIPAGILLAIKRNSVFDFVISVLVLIGQALPQVPVPRKVRIPIDSGHPFRLIPATHSGAFRHT